MFTGCGNIHAHIHHGIPGSSAYLKAEAVGAYNECLETFPVNNTHELGQWLS